MRWTWHQAKADANLKKHGVAFEDAVQAVLDPLALVMADPHPDDDRWRTLGKPSAGLPAILFVVHTEPVWLNEEWVGRIISARNATTAERHQYEEG